MPKRKSNKKFCWQVYNRKAIVKIFDHYVATRLFWKDPIRDAHFYASKCIKHTNLPDSTGLGPYYHA